MSDNDFDRGDREERRRGGGGDRRGSRMRDQSDDDGDSGGRGGRGGGRGRGRGRQRTYHCPEGRCFDYKQIDMLQRFVGETGKIKPRRQTGNCARCQRELAREVKRARHLALLPFVQLTD